MIAVEYRLGLDGFQAQRPVEVTEILHPLGRPILKAQVLSQAVHCRNGLRLAPAPIQPGSHTVIRQLGMITDKRLVDIRLLQGSIRFDHHFNNNRQAIFVGTQRCEVGGKLFGKHREDHCRGINRGGVVVGVFIDCRSIFDDRVHISDGNQDLYPV